jgi:hypothetical protein
MDSLRCFIQLVCLRPRIAISVDPAAAKARAILAPIPVTPPVAMTLFPFAEFSGRVGGIAGYGAECHALVIDGTRVDIVEG